MTRAVRSRKRRGSYRELMAGIFLSLAATAAATRGQTSDPRGVGTITGRVLDSLSAPVAGAIISLDTLDIATTADSNGSFRLRGVPPGRRTVTVHEIGFATTSVPLTLAFGETTALTIHLVRRVTALPTVRSRAVGAFGKPARLAYTMKYDEFYQRRYASSTSGLFYTHEDLEKMGAADLPDMLGHVPGLRIRQDIDGTQLAFPGCGTNHILIKVDHERVWPPDSLLRGTLGTVPAPMGRSAGTAAPTNGSHGGDPFELIGTLHLQNIEAMEVYKNMASLPDDAIGELCGAIYIWTR